MLKRIALLSVVLLGFAISVVAAPRLNKTINLGKGAKLELKKGTTDFVIVFDAKKGYASKTVGDPQVHWKGRFFYWPTKQVVYVLPNGIKILGTAMNRQGFCDELIIIRNNKVLKVVNFYFEHKYSEDHLSDITNVEIDVEDGSAYVDYKGKRGPPASYHLEFFKDSPRIIWKGTKVGWKVRWKGKAFYPVMYKAKVTVAVRTNPVQVQRRNR